MKFEQVLQAASYRIAEVVPFLHQCYGGDEVKIIDFNDINGCLMGHCIIDRKGHVYEVSLHVPGKNLAYRWLDSTYKQAARDEVASHGGNFDEAWSGCNYIEVDEEADILEKFKAVSDQVEFDPRLIVPLNLDDDTFTKIARLAHEADITFNQMVKKILQAQVDMVKQQQQ